MTGCFWPKDYSSKESKMRVNYRFLLAILENLIIDSYSLQIIERFLITNQVPAHLTFPKRALA